MVLLSEHGEKIFSQFGEDGITKKIFDIIGFGDKVCVEIGTESGDECCSRILWENYEFKQFLFDNNHENSEINLKKVTVNLENVLSLLEESNIPDEFDFLSVDIDSYDFYIVHKILTRYNPKVLVVESHPIFLKEDKVVTYDNLNNYPKTGIHCYGASALAWFNSLEDKYDFVCHENNGINMFFIRKDINKNEEIAGINNFEMLYKEHKDLVNYVSVDNRCESVTGIEAKKYINL